MLRIGLVGAGMVSTHHLRAWSEIAGAQVVAIADPDRSRLAAQAERFHIARTYSDAAEMIAAERPDALDIAAPVTTHGMLCRLAAENGVHILCQKPLDEDVRAARQVVADVGTRVRFMVHENWRFRPHYRQVGTWLAAGRIGTVDGVRFAVRSSGLVADATGRLAALDRQPFLADLRRLLVFEVLTHHLDVLRWLFGDLSVVRAALRRVCDRVRGEDCARLDLENANGVPIRLEGSLTEPDAPSAIADHLHIEGRLGSIRLEHTALRLDAAIPESREWAFEALYAASFQGALEEFVDGLSQNRRFETEASDSVPVLQLVEDVYAAADRDGTAPVQT